MSNPTDATPKPETTPDPKGEPSGQPSPKQPDSSKTDTEAEPSSTEASLTTAEKLEAAKAKHLSAKDSAASDAKTPDSSATNANASAPSSASDPKLESKTEPKPEDKKTEERASRRLALIAERDAQLTEQKQQLDTRAKEFEERAKTLDADVQFAKNLRHLVKEDPLKALELAGLDLEAVNERYMQTLRAPTPQELAQTAEEWGRKAAREEWERAEKEKADKLEAEKTAAAEKERADFTSAVAGWQDDVEKIVAANPEKYRALVGAEKTASDIWERAKKAYAPGKPFPSPQAALDLVEDQLQERLGLKKKPEPAKPPEDKQQRSGRDTRPSSTVTSKVLGEVPVRPRSTAAQRPSTRAERQARLSEAKLRHGVRD